MTAAGGHPLPFGMILRRRSLAGREVVEGRIRDAIQDLVPLLRLDDEAAVELVEYEEGTATLRLRGGCPECRMSVATLMQGIEAHLRMRVPEVRAVRAIAASPEPNG